MVLSMLPRARRLFPFIEHILADGEICWTQDDTDRTAHRCLETVNRQA